MSAYNYKPNVSHVVYQVSTVLELHPFPINDTRLRNNKHEDRRLDGIPDFAPTSPIPEYPGCQNIIPNVIQWCALRNEHQYLKYRIFAPPIQPIITIKCAGQLSFEMPKWRLTYLYHFSYQPLKPTHARQLTNLVSFKDSFNSQTLTKAKKNKL